MIWRLSLLVVVKELVIWISLLFVLVEHNVVTAAEGDRAEVRGCGFICPSRQQLFGRFAFIKLENERPGQTSRIEAAAGDNDDVERNAVATTPTKAKHIRFDKGYLNHWISSPERYAETLGMTVEEVQLRKELHQNASRDLQEKIANFTTLNIEDEGNHKTKHQLMCELRYQQGKHPFVCRNCWSYLPICLCDEAAEMVAEAATPGAGQATKIPLPQKYVERVVLWTHHREWGSISNSGSLLPLMLQDTQLLMKGLPMHDEIMEKILQNDNNANPIVVLWPDNDKTPKRQQAPSTSASFTRISWEDLQQMLQTQDGEAAPTAGTNQDDLTPAPKITLIALEGTWRTARRMASKLPNHVLRVALPPEIAFWKTTKTSDGDEVTKLVNSRQELLSQPTQSSSSSSLLKQLRQQNGGSEGNICTAEAVTAALVGMGMSKEHGERILTLLERKVDQTRRYQGRQLRDPT